MNELWGLVINFLITIVLFYARWYFWLIFDNSCAALTLYNQQYFLFTTINVFLLIIIAKTGFVSFRFAALEFHLKIISSSPCNVLHIYRKGRWGFLEYFRILLNKLQIFSLISKSLKINPKTFFLINNTAFNMKHTWEICMIEEVPNLDFSLSLYDIVGIKKFFHWNCNLWQRTLMI